MSPSIDERLLTEFVAESREHLDAIEPDLLALEQRDEQVSPDILNRIFRAVHSIKGSAGFLGINSITNLGHVMESVLMDFRDGSRQPTAATIDALLAAVDRLRAMVQGLPAGETVSYEEVLAELEAALSAEEPDFNPSPKAKAKPAPEPTGDDTPSPKTVPAVDPASEPEEAPSAAAETGPVSAPRTGWDSGRPSYGLETIRVNVRLIDRMMNLAGELVLGRNQLRRLLEEELEKIPGLSGVLQNVDLVTTDIQEQAMQFRMQPVANVLKKFPRVVRDLARHLDKEVELAIEGGDVELDRSILESLSDPLTHLVRNSVDHAIEPPDEREALGKPRSGQVSIRAFQEEGQVNITVSDDGRGINPEDVAAKAVLNGFATGRTTDRMSDTEKVSLIFLPGFSTAGAVTDLSGRGVGMDVVRTNIENIGGRLEVDSEVGRGTTVRLRLPLTLAIIPSLVVQAGGQTFAIPQMDVQELVCIQAGDAIQRVEKVGEASVLRLRGRLLPLVRLADVLKLERSFFDYYVGSIKPDRRVSIADRRQPSPEENHEDPRNDDRRAESLDRRRKRSGDYYVVVLRLGPNRFGLLVDELLSTEEIVVKPLSTHLKDCRVFSGTTIMGDGRVAMILSAGGIAQEAGLRFGEVKAEERRRQEEEARLRAEHSGSRHSVVLFNVAPEEYFALPLSSVARLEKINLSSINRIGRQEFVTYRGRGLPVIRLDRFLPVNPLPEDIEEIYLIVPRGEDGGPGLIASRIVDIVETAAEVTPERGRLPGLQGSAVVDDRLTLFLEPRELFETAAWQTPENTIEEPAA